MADLSNGNAPSAMFSSKDILNSIKLNLINKNKKNCRKLENVKQLRLWHKQTMLISSTDIDHQEIGI